MSGFDKGTGVTHKEPHARPRNLDPKTNGPFLDDVRKEQERAYRESRTKFLNEQAEKAQAELEAEEVESENDSNDTETADAAPVADDDELELNLDGDKPDNENDNASDGQ